MFNPKFIEFHKETTVRKKGCDSSLTINKKKISEKDGCLEGEKDLEKFKKSGINKKVVHKCFKWSLKRKEKKKKKLPKIIVILLVITSIENLNSLIL